MSRVQVAKPSILERLGLRKAMSGPLTFHWQWELPVSLDQEKMQAPWQFCRLLGKMMLAHHSFQTGD